MNSSENRKDKPSRLCPRCGERAVFTHEDDAGTEWFECTKCEEQTSKPRRVYERTASKPGSEDLPDVHYSILEGWGKGVAIDPEKLFLAVNRAGEEWSFRLLDRYEEWETLTSQIALQDPGQLLTSRRARPLREWLERWHPKTWRRVLDLAVAVIQNYSWEWPAQEEAEQQAGDEEAREPREPRGEAPGKPSREAEEALIQQQADELLRDPQLLFRVREGMDETIKGEQENKLLVWLLETTCQTREDYTFQTLTGESAVGKTTLARETLRYIPEKWWRRVGRMSRTALDYLKDLDWQLLWIQEARGGQEAAPSIRLSSADDGGLDVWVTERDKETGKFATTEIHLPGRSVMTTTTAVSISPEDATRNWLVSVDPSEEQTKRIVEHKLRRAAWPPELLKALGQEKPDLSPVVRAALLKLDFEARVIVPYSEDLEKIFSGYIVRARRDVDKLLGLIRVIARLHQFQRPIVEIEGCRFIVATAQDALAAFQLGSRPLTETLTGLEQRLRDVYEAVKSLDVATNTTVGIKIRKGSEYARRALRVLVELGYVDVDESSRTHVYSVRAEKAKDVLLSLQRTFSPFNLQEKVKSWLSSMSSQPPPDGVIISINRETLEWAYFDPITGKREDLKGYSKYNVQPPEVERIETDLTPPEHMPMEELIQTLGARWTRGIEQVFEDLIVELGGYTKKEAERLRKKLLEEGAMAYDPDGYLVWVRRGCLMSTKGDGIAQEKRCGDCPDLAVIETGSQIFLVCRRIGRNVRYEDTCHVEEGKP